ncbi:MAG: RNA polymerase sigma factor [Bacteroidetes bacterium]|nr:RNA polymerase sigma factor [Bacteroidota bacterium]
MQKSSGIVITGFQPVTDWYLFGTLSGMIHEKTLVDLVIAGDAAAADRLVVQHRALVFQIAVRIVASQADAEDICQEVFMAVLKGLPSFSFQCKLSSWIGRITHNVSISWLRKYRKGRMTEWPKDDPQEYILYDTPQDSIERKETFGDLRRLVGLLPHQYKTVITLYHFDEYSYTDIEAATGMPGGTVKSYLFRARKLLREKMEEERV